MKYLILAAIIVGLIISTGFFYRIGNPGTIGMLENNVIQYGKHTISCPVDIDSVVCSYYSDGGSILVTFIDADKNKHILCEDGRLGSSNKWGNIYIGGHPHYATSTLLGDDKNGHKIIYESILISKDTVLADYGYELMDWRYPTLFLLLLQRL